MRTKVSAPRAAAFFAVCVAMFVSGCGSNTTPVGVTINPTTKTVSLGGTQQFLANVTGSSTNLVTWQICLPPTTVGDQPTVCNPVTTVNTNPKQTQLPAGYGTITSGQNGVGGGLYTAPTTLPPTNNFFVVATSVQDTTAFATAIVTIDSGIRVAVNPDTAAIASGENFQFTANVSGTANTGVSWEVSGSGGSDPVVGGNATLGYICPSPNITVPCTAGQYFAPTTPPGAIEIIAVSSQDPSKSGDSSVTVSSGSNPTVTSILPNLVSEGSVEQDVYITGTGFFTTSTVLAGTPLTPVPSLYISGTVIRATIPAGPLSAAGAVPIVVQAQNLDVSTVLPGNLGLTAVPSRPAIVASLPDTLLSTLTDTNVNLVGGFFSPSTTVQVNGQSVGSTLTSSQQLTVPVSGGALPGAGLYPVIVQNSDVVAPAPAISAVNLAVEPQPSSIATAPSASIPVGPMPLGIAIDPSLGIAVVANSGTNTVSIFSLATNAPVAGSPVTVGNAPTSVSIDDQLPDHIAVVTNSADNTVSQVDLTTFAVTTLPLPNPNTPPVAAPIPYAIGINPLTHRALVAIQSSNFGFLLDFSSGQPVYLQQVGGALTPYSTGLSPTIAIDEKLNWAVVTPGGLGVINVVDLGRDPGVGSDVADLGRAPSVVATLSLSTSVQGVGIDQETHKALLSDPNGPNNVPSSPSLVSFSLMDQTIASVPFTQNNLTFSQLGLTAAAVNSLSNIGISVNGQSNTAYVVDLENSTVLQTVTGFNSPQAVAVDQGKNTAYVVNQGNSTVSVVPLGGPFNPLQIVETNPSIAFVQPAPAAIPLNVTGIGFAPGSTVYLDGTAVPTAFVNARTLTATVPATDLEAARRFVVYVKNGATLSNVTDLTVVQPISVGLNPIGVAIDPYLDQAVVTNSGSNTISVLNLLTGQTITPQAPSFFSTGTSPVGVAILARSGLAVVSNSSSNNVTILDEKGVNGTFSAPATVALCAICVNPLGVAVDQDTAIAQVVSTYAIQSNSEGAISSLAVALTTSDSAPTEIDLGPVAVAIDPDLNLAGVAIASQAGALDFQQLGPFFAPSPVTNLQLPSGVVYDPVNLDFLVANSLVNTVVVVDPGSGVVLGSIRTGINPTSLDYNYDTSTLVTANSESNSVSVIDYVCAPNPSGTSTCPNPQVHDVFSAASPVPTSSVIIGPNSIAIDTRLNLAVQVDQSNNRILLIPLPH